MSVFPQHFVSKRYYAPFSCRGMGFNGTDHATALSEEAVGVQPEIITSLVEKGADINTQVRQNHRSRNSMLVSVWNVSTPHITEVWNGSRLSLRTDTSVLSCI